MIVVRIGKSCDNMRRDRKDAEHLLFRIGVQQALANHQNGDWGDLSEDDRQMNDTALQDDNEIMSSYNIGTDRIWIITEWDRSVTTILLPEEY